MVGRSVENLSVGRWSVVDGWWVGRGPVGGSVVSDRWSVGGWRTCRLFGGRLSVVCGFVICRICIYSHFSVFQNSDYSKNISEFPTTISPWLQAHIYWNAVCYLTTSIANIHFSYFTFIVSQKQSKRSILSTARCLIHNTISSYPLYQVDCVCLKNLFRKFEYCVYLRKVTLREKCPNTESFLVRIFLHSDWIWRFTP